MSNNPHRTLKVIASVLCAVSLLAAAGCARVHPDRGYIRFAESVTPEQEERIKDRLKRMRAAIVEKNLDQMAAVIREMESPYELGFNLNVDSKEYLKSLADTSSMSAIHFAAATGFIEGVDHLLQHGADIDSRYCVFGATPLHWAAGEGQLEMVKFLLARGARINAKDAEGGTPALFAIGTGEAATAEYLIAQGGRAKFEDSPDGTTALHAAVWIEKNGPAMTKLLLDLGENPNARDDEGQTPLHYAAEHDNLPIARVLVEHGAKLRIRDEWGDTPAMLARDEENEEMLEFLVEKEKTPLHRAIDSDSSDDAKAFMRGWWNKKYKISPDDKSYMHYAVASRNPAWIRLLCEKGCPINAKDEETLTPLHHAARDNKPEMIKALLSCGARMDVGAEWGWSVYSAGYTPFHIAVEEGHIECVRAMIEMRQDVNQPRQDVGGTPLSVAVIYGRKRIAELLIENGADVNAGNHDGWTPLHLAPDAETVRMLIEAGGDVHARTKSGFAPLHKANDAAMARLLIEAGADVRARSEDGRTPLHVAAAGEDPELVRTLIANGADINARSKNMQTPVFGISNSLLFHFDSADVIRALLEAGGNACDRDNNGRTPLHWAAFFGMIDRARILIYAGAEVNARDSEGQTPLHFISPVGNRDQTDIMARLLLDYGAKCEAEDEDGRTPLHNAVQLGDVSRVRVLLEAGADPDARTRKGETPADLAESCIEEVEKASRKGIPGEDDLAEGFAWLIAGSWSPLIGQDPEPYREILKLLEDYAKQSPPATDAKRPLESNADANSEPPVRTR